MVTLYCFIQGSTVDQPFFIHIDEGRSIDDLKEAVKKELSPTLDNHAAAELSLYRVSVSGEDAEELQRIIDRIDPIKDRLNALKTVGQVFPSPIAGHIHLSSGRPVSCHPELLSRSCLAARPLVRPQMLIAGFAFCAARFPHSSGGDYGPHYALLREFYEFVGGLR